VILSHHASLHGNDMSWVASSHEQESCKMAADYIPNKSMALIAGCVPPLIGKTGEP